MIPPLVRAPSCLRPESGLYRQAYEEDVLRETNGFHAAGMETGQL